MKDKKWAKDLENGMNGMTEDLWAAMEKGLAVQDKGIKTLQAEMDEFQSRLDAREREMDMLKLKGNEVYDSIGRVVARTYALERMTSLEPMEGEARLIHLIEGNKTVGMAHADRIGEL